MGYRGNLYDLVLVLHILSAIAGFGGVMFNGIYGRESAQMRGIGAFAITSANEKASLLAEKFIFAVPVFGVLMVLLSDGVITFGQAWLLLAIVIYAAAVTGALAVLKPGGHRLVELTEQLASMGPPPEGAAPGGPPPQVAELEALGKRMATVGGSLQLAMVIVLALMVFKPGI